MITLFLLLLVLVLILIPALYFLLESIEMSLQSKKIPHDQYELNTGKCNHNHIQPISDIFFFFVNVWYLKAIKSIISTGRTGGSLYLRCHCNNSSFSKTISLHYLRQETGAFCTCIGIEILMNLEVDTHLLNIKKFFFEIFSIHIKWTK